MSFEKLVSNLKENVDVCRFHCIIFILFLPRTVADSKFVILKSFISTLFCNEPFLTMYTTKCHVILEN